MPRLSRTRFDEAATVGNGVFVATSIIPDSGRGLFAGKNFKKGELVTEFYGYVITKKEAAPPFPYSGGTLPSKQVYPLFRVRT